VTAEKEIRHEMRERAVEYLKQCEAQFYGLKREGAVDDDVIDTVRCERCKVYHQAGGPHECAAQIEAPR
jgi:hypothetical protein